MLQQNIQFRPMEMQDIPAVKAVKRRSFQWFESLMQGIKKQGYVLVDGTKVNAVIDYKYLDKEHKEVYINTACVDPTYASAGLGKFLYRSTIEALTAQGVEKFSALVKDDNVASYHLFQDNGFVRSGIFQIISKMGGAFFLKQLLKTPFLFAVGMDLYVKDTEVELETKYEGGANLVWFYFLNLVLSLPFIFSWLGSDTLNVNQRILILLLTLTAFILPRFLLFLYFRIQKKPKRTIIANRLFRHNNGGALVVFLLAFVRAFFFMNANAYRESYPYDRKEQRPYFVAEILRAVLLFFVVLLGIVNKNAILVGMSQLSALLLLFYALPFYPFEMHGSQRIKQHSHATWILVAIVAIITFVLRNFVF